jgi:hypothetical protein
MGATGRSDLRHPARHHVPEVQISAVRYEVKNSFFTVKEAVKALYGRSALPYTEPELATKGVKPPCGNLASKETEMPRFVMMTIFVVIATVVLHAQTNTGTITGTVFDQQRAVISGAKITAVNVNTGVSQVAVATSVGSYTIPSLVPGQYRVSAEMTGFSPVTQLVEVATSRTVTLAACG